MERKRRHESTREDASRRSRRRIIYSSSEDEEIVALVSSPEHPVTSHTTSSRSVSTSRVRQSIASHSMASSQVRQNLEKSPRGRQKTPRALSPIVIVDQHPAPPSPPASPRNVSPTPGTSSEKEPVRSEELELDEDLLELLGDAPKEDTPLGPAIHKDVAKRWQDILAKGLPKDIKEKLLQEYLVPSNCDLLQSPTLNPEAKVALTEIMVRRDTSLMHKQKQLGLALAAMAKTMELVFSNETSKKNLLKPLSDACRILCDSHYVETKTRRNLVLSTINTDLKETLIESPRDAKLLFGENVSEKLKAAKTIQRSGESLKTPQKFTKSNFYAKNNKSRLNFKPIHRKADGKQTSADSTNAGRVARAPPPPRQSRGGAPQRQSYRDRSPPPPPRRPFYRR